MTPGIPAWQLFGTLLTCAELILLLVRSRDLQVVLKSPEQRTDSE